MASLTSGDQHRAPQQPQVRVALALQEKVQHAQQHVLRAGLHRLPRPVLQGRGKRCLVVGGIDAGPEMQVHAGGWRRRVLGHLMTYAQVDTT